MKEAVHEMPGYRIDSDFIGGNIRIIKLEKHQAFLSPDLRDTQGDWFYFNFRVRGAGGKTLTFIFSQRNISPFGVAISHDGVSYAFSPEKMRFSEKDFTYAFEKGENEVYFAFSFPYQVARFEALADALGLSVKTLCISEGGRSIPYLLLGNEKSENAVVFTCRHHACESVASYVLEGAIKSVGKADFLKTHVLYILPFIDIDGVEKGDQGKNRIPHDHNRDYIDQPIYHVTRAFLELIRSKTVQVLVDFHDPWLYGGINDFLSFVYSRSPDPDLDELSSLLEDTMRDAYFPYRAENNTPLNTLWNVPSASAKDYFATRGAQISLSVEIPYFGLKLPKEEAFLSIGDYFVVALNEFLLRHPKNDRTRTCDLMFTGDLLCPAELTEKTQGKYEPCFKKSRKCSNVRITRWQIWKRRSPGKHSGILVKNTDSIRRNPI